MSRLLNEALDSETHWTGMNQPNETHCLSDSRYISTAQVAKGLGVSVTTVKRWVDDGILPAYRTPGGHRKLLLADVLRLARDGQLPHADLSLIDPRAAAGADLTDLHRLALELLQALKEGDAPLVRGLIHGAYHAGLPIEELADQIVAPAMHAIGREWEIGVLDVMHEHRASQLCAAVLYELKAVLEANAERDRPVAVGGAPEDDHSQLPSLLAQMTLLDAGWDAVNLGPHTPLRSFATSLTEFRPRLIWLSLSHLPHPQRFLEQYREFFALAERAEVPVAIGGRVLSDASLRSAMPYTFHGDTLSHLATYARSLHRRPQPPKRGRPRRADSENHWNGNGTEAS